MTAPETLKKVERRAYRSTFADGIYDILFGLGFLILALTPALDSIGVPRLYGYLSAPVLAVVIWLGKRYITIPRLGAVRFGAKRRAKKWQLALICAAVVFLIMPLLFMMASENISGSRLWIYVAPLAALFMALAAYFLDYPRLYIYALVLTFGIFQVEFLHTYVGRPLNSLLGFGIPGVVILGYGMSLLVDFMKKYPKPTPEAPHAGQ